MKEKMSLFFITYMKFLLQIQRINMYLIMFFIYFVDFVLIFARHTPHFENHRQIFFRDPYQFQLIVFLYYKLSKLPGCSAHSCKQLDFLYV